LSRSADSVKVCLQNWNEIASNSDGSVFGSGLSLQKKCESYWAAPHQSAAFGPFTVTSNSDCQLSDVRSVVQFQYLSWPDHDVPYENAGVLDLLERARSSRGGDTAPVLVHCSAGCGRTGVICALDYIYDLLVTKRISQDFSILSIVLELRRQRPSAVQTKVGALSPDHHLQHFHTLPWNYNIFFPLFVVICPQVCNLFQTLPSSHHYDNDCKGASSAPIYSTVKPKEKPRSLPPSASPIYDIATPASQSIEGSDYHLVSGLLGFNCRIQKPKGPRDPPAEWGRLER
uniref:protein-tyrosine-phosphatase n=1 Tax=Cyprinodon variegatus TaxID=28743 RepID=A0A3Q2D4U9_CYPVA